MMLAFIGGCMPMEALRIVLPAVINYRQTVFTCLVAIGHQLVHPIVLSNVASNTPVPIFVIKGLSVVSRRWRFAARLRRFLMLLCFRYAALAVIRSERNPIGIRADSL